MSIAGRRIEVRGIVQGVGFRPWVFKLANDGGLTGRVHNDAAGVIIDAFGTESALDRFAERLLADQPPAAEIVDVHWHAIPIEELDRFTITASADADELRVSIPPDLAICPECLAEIFDRANRRYRYPFTNCTHCGPRFTIAVDVPYDRAATTMARFAMCEECRREYDDPSDRRFHAQPNACPACGPRLTLTTNGGRQIDCGDPIEEAAGLLERGAIVAIKGLGGFHLACDATDSEAVKRLRLRKRREQKPFAVMAADLDAAARLAILSDDERRLLSSPIAPIVLAQPRQHSPLAALVAPDAPLVGVMLPYTPLHHLLMRAVSTPLVMTSGNLSDEPLAFRNDDALERLSGLADYFLLHDRDIETFCDDSVTRIIAGSPSVLRRSRGYVPRPVRVLPPFSAPVLACGALLKNTFCFGLGDSAYPGPHLGDLSTVAAHDAFVAAIDRMTRFLRVEPEVIACDLHPDYLSTRYALARPEAVKIGVQHHHAHIASVMAEHALRGPVLGVAYDGTGYGLDGTAWGGEILLADLDRFDRVATLRPIRLAGGDAAIREPWRIAVALLLDAFDGEVPASLAARLSGISDRQIAAVARMIDDGVHAPFAHGAGRYFDGIGALVLGRTESAYEGQIALAWNGVADPMEKGGYAFTIDHSSRPWTIDLRLMVRSIADDLDAGVPAPIISARFHDTLVEATALTIESAAMAHGHLPVAMSGGCFHNPRLAESLITRLSPQFDTYINRRVPAGDGGVALGQAVVAAAIAKGR
ncbi:MAG TPA: carbamoyltransferase HypF [Vicinamibacterales bacterium]